MVSVKMRVFTWSGVKMRVFIWSGVEMRVFIWSGVEMRVFIWSGVEMRVFIWSGVEMRVYCEFLTTQCDKRMSPLHSLSMVLLLYKVMVCRLNSRILYSRYSQLGACVNMGKRAKR